MWPNTDQSFYVTNILHSLDNFLTVNPVLSWKLNYGNINYNFYKFSFIEGFKRSFYFFFGRLRMLKDCAKNFSATSYELSWHVLITTIKMACRKKFEPMLFNYLRRVFIRFIYCFSIVVDNCAPIKDNWPGEKLRETNHVVGTPLSI